LSDIRIDNIARRIEFLGTSLPRAAYQNSEEVMKAYFSKLPTKHWLLFVVPALVIGYPIARIVLPAVVHAVLPEVVRNVLHYI
jgi:hypothetical protein